MHATARHTPERRTHVKPVKNTEKYLEQTVGNGFRAGGNIIHREGDTKRTRNGAQSDAVPLDQTAKFAIWKICHDVPTMRLAREKFEDRLFDLPFEVSIGSMQTTQEPTVAGQSATRSRQRVNGSDKGMRGTGYRIFLNSRMRERIVKTKWMPWLRQMHRWLTMYGVAPYYFTPFSIHKKLGLATDGAPASTASAADTAADPENHTFLPQCPDFFIGDIEVYTKDGKLKYQWRWAKNASHARAGDVDPGFMFLVRDPPSVKGDYTTAVSALLQDTQQLEMYRQLEKSVSLQTIVPQHVIEMHPGSAAVSGSGALEGAPLGATNFFSLPSSVTDGSAPPQNAALRSVEAYQRQSHEGARTRDVLGEIGISAYGDSYNSRATIDGPSDDYAVSELRSYFENHPELGVIREGVYPPNSIILKPYERHAKVPPPSLPQMKYLDHLQRMDRIYALAGAYPLSMLLHTGVHQGSQFEAAQTYLVSELRAWGKFWSERLKDIFYRAHFPFFRKLKQDNVAWNRARYGRPPTFNEMIEMEDRIALNVFFPKAPHMSFEQLKEYYAHRMISEDDFRRYALVNVNLEGLEKPTDYETAVKTLYDYKQYQAPDPVDSTSLNAAAGPASGVTESNEAIVKGKKATDAVVADKLRSRKRTETEGDGERTKGGTKKRSRDRDDKSDGDEKDASDGSGSKQKKKKQRTSKK